MLTAPISSSVYLPIAPPFPFPLPLWRVSLCPLSSSLAHSYPRPSPPTPAPAPVCTSLLPHTRTQTKGEEGCRKVEAGGRSRSDVLLLTASCRHSDNLKPCALPLPAATAGLRLALRLPCTVSGEWRNFDNEARASTSTTSRTNQTTQPVSPAVLHLESQLVQRRQPVLYPQRARPLPLPQSTDPLSRRPSSPPSQPSPSTLGCVGQLVILLLLCICISFGPQL